MSIGRKFSLNELATFWEYHLQTDPSFTNSDVMELKSHLLDISEELVLKGLSEEEAFLIAAKRLGDPSILKNEFKTINSSLIQIRKTIQISFGILIFFLFHFLMLSSTRTLILLLEHFSSDYMLNFRIVTSFMLIFPLSVLVSTLILYFSSPKTVIRFEKIRIRPIQTLCLFCGTIALVLLNEYLDQRVTDAFNIGSYSSVNIYTLFDYMHYILPLVSILCFIILYRKFDRAFNYGATNSDSNADLPDTPNNIPDEELQEFEIEPFRSIGLTDNESVEIIRLRNGGKSIKSNLDYYARSSHPSGYNILIIFSGILAYFLIFYFLHATAKLLFTILQNHSNDPLLNIKYTFLYMLFFQFCIICLTVALYFKDRLIIQLITRIKVRPKHTIVIFITTVVVAILDRLLIPISRYSIHSDYEMKGRLIKVFIYSDLFLPFIIGAGFLILFFKYYRDNIRI